MKRLPSESMEGFEETQQLTIFDVNSRYRIPSMSQIYDYNDLNTMIASIVQNIRDISYMMPLIFGVSIGRIDVFPTFMQCFP
jgi:hypothetical protein